MDDFLLWHVNELPDGGEAAKLIGLYATADDAERAKLRALARTGFRDQPDGFEIDRYTLGEDHWSEGYVTLPRRGARGKSPSPAPD